MARYMHAEQTAVYRAAISLREPGQPPELAKTYYRGPYAGRAQAIAEIRRAKRYRWYNPEGEVTGRVEVSRLVWEDVDTSEPGVGRIHTDRTGARYVNTGDNSDDCWLRLGPVEHSRWFRWHEIKDL